MDTLEAYAPPKAAVTDAEAESPRIPLGFKILLCTFVVLDVLGALMGGAGGGIVWGACSPSPRGARWRAAARRRACSAGC
jgi:hypothetical protein